jgi:tetratricopeptide (TPR) repeat protein
MNFWKNLFGRREEEDPLQHRQQAEQYGEAEQQNNQQVVHFHNLQVMRLIEQGQDEQALKSATYARDLARQLLADDDMYFATALNNLARVYDGMSNYAAAEPLYVQALEVMRKAGVEEHPYYVDTLNRLAQLRRERAYAADSFLSQALETWPNDAVMVEAMRDISTDVQRAEEAKTRYQQSGDLRALDEWVATVERIFDHPQFGRFPWPIRLEIMKETGGSYLERYDAIGRIEDLDHALRLLQDAVEQVPPASSVLPLFLINLGSGLAKRYERTGNLADLERSIEAHQQAVEQTDPHSPDFPGYLYNLGNGLGARYERTGNLDDLERSIEAHQQAVEQTDPHSPDFPYFLYGLGSRLQSRYERTGNLDDLERSIEVREKVVEQTDPHSPDFSSSANGLGNGLGARYERTGNLDDLERSIEAYEKAVERTDPGSFAFPGYLSNLGRGLRLRHERTRNLDDLERAMQALRDAAQLMPPESPELVSISMDLGRVLRDRFAETEELPDLREAINIWEESWSRLQTTFVASPVAYKLGQQDQLTRLSTLLVLAYLELARTSLPETGVARRRALEVVEGSKSRLLTELVGRGDLLAPPSILPQLANRERQLLNELTAFDTVELAQHGSPVASKAEVSRIPRLQRREQLRRELESLWVQIAQAGHEAADYVALRRGTSLSWEDIAGLVAELGSGTVLISYFSTDDSALLFIMRSGWEEPVVVEIDFDETAQIDLMRRLFRELHTSGGSIHRGQTWDRQLRPLLEKAVPYIDGASRIVLGPYSRGHVIPWSILASRAGWSGPDRQILPLVTLPALGLLPRLQHHRPAKETSVLVVGNPLGDLQYAEEEAREIAAMLGEEALLGPQANKAEVRAGLSDATVIHLATHAYFHPDSPLDSGIVLADGVLTAREVMSYRLQADLLVISACQTGIAEALSGDEVAGLAQAFLHAGARSLIVTLWNVNDSSTASLMRTFYDARRAGVDKAQALSKAMATVQAQENWHHPYYWGAFVFVGYW